MGEATNKYRDKRGRLLPGHPYRFKTGEVANPKGRPPKDFSLTSLAKAALEADPTLGEKAVKKWLDQVVEGKTEARRDLQDRLEGKVPVPPVELGGEVVIRVKYDEEAQ